MSVQRRLVCVMINRKSPCWLLQMVVRLDKQVSTDDLSRCVQHVLLSCLDKSC